MFSTRCRKFSGVSGTLPTSYWGSPCWSAQLHNTRRIIPHGLADYATSFATAPLQEVLDAMARENS
jgi:hypothetical protein